jgi:HEPN domain-containing protein
MDEVSFARLLWQSAKHDAAACATLAADPAIHDSIVGFHAQQAVEKALKAVLAHRRVAFRRTHDIVELLDLLSDHDLDPPHAARLDELNPYAVAARYGLLDPGALNRAEAQHWVADVLNWASALLDVSDSDSGSADR